jgi:hypothetical protein
MKDYEFMKLAHRVKMCVCNRLYDAAYQQIQQLSEMGVTMTVVDAGYNEWERQRNV